VRCQGIGRSLGFIAAIALSISGGLPPLHVHVGPHDSVEHWHSEEHAHHSDAIRVIDDDDDRAPRFLDQTTLPWRSGLHVPAGVVADVVQAVVVTHPHTTFRYEPAWRVPPSAGPPPSTARLRAPPSAFPL